MNNNDYTEYMIARMLEESPFQEKPEYKDSDGHRNDLYYEDFNAYCEALILRIKNALKQEGDQLVCYYTYRSCMVNHSARYTCYVDGLIVLEKVEPKAWKAYWLMNLENDDIIRDEQFLPLSGRQMRQSYNRQEQYFFSNGGKQPRYSYGPGIFSSQWRGDNWE